MRQDAQTLRPTFTDYLLHAVYLPLYGLVKYVPSPLGDPLRRWCLKLFLRKLRKARIYEGVTIWYPYRVEIGNHVSLNEWVYLDGSGGVVIEDDVRIAHRVSIMSSDHVYQDLATPIRLQGLVSRPTSIGADAWIGCNATILMGVRIGTGAIVAAGAVVTRDVADYAIVAGVPARQIGVRGGDAGTGAGG
jgi:acetyltransferase-like isoleucine patch superfamily enzyme